MDHNQQEQIALHRWAVIAEAAGDKLTPRERGALVRQIACWPPFLLSVKSASGVIAGEGHLRRCGTGRATTP